MADELYALRWGPTRVPIYDFLLLSTIMRPESRQSYLAIARWLVETVGVPVDAPDLSGTRALSHAISTKPFFDRDYAQIMLDAGGDVNQQNRYGCTAAHDMC